MSFQVSDVSCTRNRSERAKRAHSLYNICRDISQLSSADEERLHGSLDSTDGNLASDVSTRCSGRPQLNSLRTTRASGRNVGS